MTFQFLMVPLPSSKYITPLKSTQNLYQLMITSLYFMWLVSWKYDLMFFDIRVSIYKIMIGHISRRVTKLGVYAFSGSFFTKLQKKEDKFKVPLFKNREEEQPSQLEQFQKDQHSSRKDIQQLIKKINETNQYFMGVRMNTNYLKINTVVKYADIVGEKLEKITISELPIDIAKEDTSEGFQNFDQSLVVQRKAGQICFGNCDREKVVQEMKKLIRDYIVDLAGSGRFKNLQPNFQRQNIRLRNTASSQFTLTLKAPQSLPQIKIKDITLLKGMQVNRNDNYSSDSYAKDESEVGEGIVNYTLYKQKKERYPEVEWFSTKMINVRFQVLVRGGPVLEVTQGESVLGSSGNVVHRVVIQSDMLPPPPISQHQLTPQKYLRSYRLDRNCLTITNFDRKNQFFPLTYSEIQKKSTLINKIQ